MLPLETRKFLFDIQQACRTLAVFVAGKTFDDYIGDALLRSAVERQFEIIGEALRRATLRTPSLEQRISEARRIIAFRNRLIHAYASIADEVVWGVVESGLPTLTREVEEILQQREGSGGS